MFLTGACRCNKNEQEISVMNPSANTFQRSNEYIKEKRKLYIELFDLKTHNVTKGTRK